jgi:hypothetical protein
MPVFVPKGIYAVEGPAPCGTGPAAAAGRWKQAPARTRNPTGDPTVLRATFLPLPSAVRLETTDGELQLCKKVRQFRHFSPFSKVGVYRTIPGRPVQ